MEFRLSVPIASKHDGGQGVFRVRHQVVCVLQTVSYSLNLGSEGQGSGLGRVNPRPKPGFEHFQVSNFFEPGVPV